MLFTVPEPGTTIASLIDALTFFPSTTFAASRRSSILEFVQEPIKTLSNCQIR